MQRLAILFLTAGLLLPAGPSRAATAFPREVAVHLNSVPLQFDVPVRFSEQNLMLPLRKVFEEMGYLVAWEAEAQRAVLRSPGRVIILYPQNPLYSINGVVNRTAHAPFIENGRVMVSLDFLRESAGVKELLWDEQDGILHLEYRTKEDDKDGQALPGEGEQGAEKYDYFIEILLPPGNRVQVGEEFEIRISAPLVKGIYSYEVRFFYNPEVIKIKDIKNPFYMRQQEFYLKRINNKEGIVEYTLTTQGYHEEIPPRERLVVIEAIGFREGAVPLLKGTLQVKMLDNTANSMPVALEEKTLYIIK